MHIDLNCDLGEGCAFDAELMPLITSANISCGAHAGDPETMSAALALAKQHGVQVGAHPGFADREHFGRRELAVSPAEVLHQCQYQIGGFVALAAAAGVQPTYVKPHGALYNMASRDAALARPIVHAANQFQLAVMGLPKSTMAEVCAAEGKRGFIAEGFADRRYCPDGSLVPRSQPDAFVADPDEAVRQAEWLVKERGVQTLCVHGDNPRAVEFVRLLRAFLEKTGFWVQRFSVSPSASS